MTGEMRLDSGRVFAWWWWDGWITGPSNFAEEIVDSLLDGLDALGIIVGDVEAKLLLNGHDDFDVIKGVGAKIGLKASSRSHLRLFAGELFGEDDLELGEDFRWLEHGGGMGGLLGEAGFKMGFEAVFGLGEPAMAFADHAQPESCAGDAVVMVSSAPDGFSVGRAQVTHGIQADEEQAGDDGEFHEQVTRLTLLTGLTEALSRVI